MKKILILLLFIPIILHANPIWLGVSISEINFNNTGEWTLEIDNITNASVVHMDSLIIESNSGKAKIIEFDTVDYIVIANENLNNSISIDKNADCIKLYSYSFGEFKTDSICIGEIAGSYLKDVKNGQSISRLYGYGSFYKDNSPTIGKENDLDGSKGKIYGHFYNTTGELLKNKYFFINEGYCTEILQQQGFAGNVVIDGDGFYCAEITSRSYFINNLEIYTPITNAEPEIELMNFQPVNFELNENDSINIDFTQKRTSIKTDNQKRVFISNYPNPARHYTYFIFSKNQTKFSSLFIKVYNIEGQIVDSFVPDSSEFLWDCSNLQHGTYIFTLSIDNELVGSNKFQIIR